MKTVVINNIDEMKQYYNKESDTYVFNVDLVVFGCDIVTQANIQAKDIYAQKIFGKKIDCYNIYAESIEALNINAYNIIVNDYIDVSNSSNVI